MGSETENLAMKPLAKPEDDGFVANIKNDTSSQLLLEEEDRVYGKNYFTFNILHYFLEK